MNNRTSQLPSSRYDPHTRRVHLPKKASPYERAHELAHQAQHQQQTLAWRLDQACAGIPLICRLTRLAVEVQARNMALSDLHAQGRRTTIARAEAQAGIWSYVRAIVWLPTPNAIRSAWMDL